MPLQVADFGGSKAGGGGSDSDKVLFKDAGECNEADKELLPPSN